MQEGNQRYEREKFSANRKTSQDQTKPGANSGAFAGGREDGQYCRSLPSGADIAGSVLHVEEKIQDERDRRTQVEQEGSQESSRGSARVRRAKARITGNQGRSSSSKHRAFLAEKKRELGLEGTLKGRHLSIQERVGLMELIEVGESMGIELKRICEVLELHRQAVYRWRCGQTSSNRHGGGGGMNKIRPEEKALVLERARAEPEKRCRRITYDLEREGKISIGKTTVANILREHGLNHPFERGTKKEKIVPAEILLHEPWRKNLLWGLDWTWVHVGESFMYLVVLLDWYSRKILSWGLFRGITSFEIVAIITDAVAKEEIDLLPEGALRPRLVADHGSPNTSRYTRENIEIQGLHLWLSGIGRPTGNARTERVIGTLQNEEIKLQDYSNEKQALSSIGGKIHDYNDRRPNQGVGGFAPSLVHFYGRKFLIENRRRARQEASLERITHWKQLQNQTSAPVT
jgi:putative transposase